MDYYQQLENTNREKISKLIKKTRAELGITQSHFAFELSIGLPRSITKQYISQWELGRKVPSIWLMFSIQLNAESRFDNTPAPFWPVEMSREIIRLLQESDNEKKKKGNNLPAA